VIELKGSKSSPESAEHIIKFPGGSISVCRTSNDEYWAHISVNKEQVVSDITNMSKTGRIEMVRIDTPDGVKEVDAKDTDHFAVLISTSKEDGSM
jgi:hypothetical protein